MVVDDRSSKDRARPPSRSTQKTQANWYSPAPGSMGSENALPSPADSDKSMNLAAESLSTTAGGPLDLLRSQARRFNANQDARG